MKRVGTNFGLASSSMRYNFNPPLKMAT